MYAQIDGQVGIGAEGMEEVTGEEEKVEDVDKNPNTTLQQSIPSIHTLEK